VRTSTRSGAGGERRIALDVRGAGARADPALAPGPLGGVTQPTVRAVDRRQLIGRLTPGMGYQTQIRRPIPSDSGRKLVGLPVCRACVARVTRAANAPSRPSHSFRQPSPLTYIQASLISSIDPRPPSPGPTRAGYQDARMHPLWPRASEGFPVPLQDCSLARRALTMGLRMQIGSTRRAMRI